MVGQRELYGEVTKVAEDYFGPASSRVVSRLINNHLQKNPEDLCEEDMAELTKWIKLAVSVVTEDKALIKEFIDRLQGL